jgi:hypothetical protein
MCATGTVTPEQRGDRWQDFQALYQSGSLSIALWLVGTLWIVNLIAHLAGAPGELVVAILVAGWLAGGLELQAANRRAGG